MAPITQLTAEVATEFVTEAATEAATKAAQAAAQSASTNVGMFAGIANDFASGSIVLFILIAVLGYLIGSLNLSIVLSKSKGKDIRKMGSGNAGTTNTLRTMGISSAVMVLIFDIAKGCLVPLALIQMAEPNPWIVDNVCITMAYIYGVFAVIGHCFPIYYGFKGGKGIATALGALIVISPVATCIAVVEFLIMVVLFRYVSLGSIVAVINIPLFTYLLNIDIIDNRQRLMAATIAIALIALFKHMPNVKRLREGTESPLFGKKKKKETE